jgi:Skp family chaperone for outer membrane proteins
MSARTKARLSAEIDREAAGARLERERDRQNFEAERRKIVSEISQRIMPVVENYAKQKGYALVVVLDREPQEPAAISRPNDITEQVVSLFDCTGLTP